VRGESRAVNAVKNSLMRWRYIMFIYRYLRLLVFDVILITWSIANYCNCVFDVLFIN